MFHIDIKSYKPKQNNETCKNHESSRKNSENVSCKRMKVLKFASNTNKCCCCTASETVVIIPSSSDSIACKKNNTPFELCDHIDEMLCLCECINIKGFNVSDEPGLKSITYEELYKVS